MFTKKPTGLEKKPFGPKYPAKFSKYQNYKKSPKLAVKKVRLAPIPDLRPTSIDRIDILRWAGTGAGAGREICVILELFQTPETAAVTQAGSEEAPGI